MGDINVIDNAILFASTPGPTIYQSDNAIGADIITSSDLHTLNDSQSFNVVSQTILAPLTEGTGIEDADWNSELHVRKNGEWVILSKSIFPDTPDAYLYEQFGVFTSFKNLATGNSIHNKDRYVSINDLLAMGIAKQLGGGTGYLVPNVDIIPTGARLMSVPPAPSNVTLVPRMTDIQLFWDAAGSKYTNHSHAEVFRGVTGNINEASKIATVYLGYTAIDTSCVYGTIYRYWVRFVNDIGVIGPFHHAIGALSTLVTPPTSILTELEGKIGLSQLEASLLEPIQLISMPGGLIDTQSELNQSIIQETLARQTSIAAQADAWAAAILLEAQARGTSIDSVQNLITTGNTQLAQQIETVSASLGEGFTSINLWQFDTDDDSEGWNSNLGGPGVGGGYLILDRQDETFITSPGIAIDGMYYSQIRVRLRKVGNPIWDGSLLYTTEAEPNFDSARMAFIPEPTFIGNFATASWEMREAFNWQLSIITGLRIHLTSSNDPSNYYKVDSIVVGKVGPTSADASITEERLVRISSIAAEATKRETLAVQLRGTSESTNLADVTSGIIFEEKTARVADNVSILSKVSRLQAGIRTENANGELSDALGGWKSLAALTEESYVRATADEASVTKTTLLESRIDANDASISLISTTQVTASESLAQELQTIDARFGTTNAAIVNEQIARSTAITSLAQTTSNLSTTVNNNYSFLTSAINAEYTARIAEDTALANSLNSLYVTVNTLSSSTAASFSTEATTRANAVSAVAQSVTTLSGTVVSNDSAVRGLINSEASTRLSATNALSTRADNLQVEVNNSSAAIQVTSSALGDINSNLSANYNIKLGIDTNGKYYAAGMSIGVSNTLAGGAQSEVIFLTDRFTIMKEINGTTVKPFIVQGNQVIMNNAVIGDATISFAKITDTLQSSNYVPNTSGWAVFKNGTCEFQNVKARGDIEAQSLKAGTVMVNTLNVAGEAITVVRYGEGTSATLANNTQATAVALTSMTLPAGVSGVLLTTNLLTTASGSRCNVFVGFMRNGVLLREFGGGALQDQGSTTSFNYFDASPGTNPTYSLRLRAGANANGNGAGGFSYYSPTLTAHGAKR